MSKIYTRQGDNGKSLSPDGLKNKNDITFEIFGTIDEVQAHVGLLYETMKDHQYFLKLNENLKLIMKELYKISSSLYTKNESLTDNIVKILENWIDEMDNDLLPLTEFILPIGSKSSAQAHIVRVLVRKLERLFIGWDNDMKYKEIRIFLNRLSDYFFTLARFLEEK